MTAAVAGIRRRTGPVGRWVGRFSSAVSAVSIKELRGRMREAVLHSASSAAHVARSGGS